MPKRSQRRRGFRSSSIPDRDNLGSTKGVVPTDTNQWADEPSLQRQLLDRLRFILLVIASMSALFVLDELLTADHPFGAFLAFRASGVALPLITVFVLRQRWAEAWAWPLTIGIVAAAYPFVAAAGLAS